MSRRTSPSARTTLYRLKDVKSLRRCIRTKYLHDSAFETEIVQVGTHEGLLVTGKIDNGTAAWCGRLSDLAGARVKLGNITATAALLIRDGTESAWALTYGAGFQLLDAKYIDPGFGMRLAIRAASPDAIKSLTRTALDHRSRTDRSSIPAGEALRGFGIEDFGEVVTRLVGEAILEGLTIGDEPLTIRAADALSLPLAKTQSALLSDLRMVARTLEQTPKRELEILEQFVKVKSAFAEDLNRRLTEALRAGNSKIQRLALGWPHERIDDNGTPSSFKFTGVGRGATVQDDIPTIQAIVEVLRNKNPEDPLQAARSVKIILFRDADGEEAISKAVSVLNWLAYEVEVDGSRYCFFDGSWYQMDTEYAQKLSRHVHDIFERRSPVELPSWDRSRHKHESDYNDYAAHEIGGVMLDREMIRTEHHATRGFESCDIVSRSGDLVHIKHTPSSAEASHLLAQAIVSTDALRHDEQARAEFKKTLEACGGSASWIGERNPKSVVLALAKPEKIGPEDLFSFTQVTLARFDSQLAEVGIDLYIEPVERSKEPG